MKLFGWTFGGDKEADKAGPKWLEYGGQSTDELLRLRGHYRTDSIVVAFETALLRKDSALTPVESLVLSVEALEREVNNGGYSQFFRNAPEYAVGIVADVNAIGCDKTAEITQTAIDCLRIGEPIASTSIEAALERDDAADCLQECDSNYFAAGEDIAERLLDYIATNRASVSI